MDLTPLKAAVDRVRAEQLRPPEKGEVKRIGAIEDHFSDDDWLELHTVVREVAHAAPRTFARFFGEVRIAHWIVDALVDEPGVPTLAWLCQALEERATDEGPWLVVTPLAHVEPPDDYVELSDTAGLAPVIQEHDLGSDPHPGSTRLEQRRHLGDGIEPRLRWLQSASKRVPFPVDTGASCAVITVEEGTEGVAINRARTRALMALAVWTLVATPGFRRMWPAVGDWAPQPSIELSAQHKPFEPDPFAGSSAPKSSRTHYGPYVLPRDVEQLRMPFAAMDHVDHRSAHVLLTTAWSLFHARRTPSMLEATDRALYLSTALAGLCEPPRGISERPLERWQRLRQRLGLRDELYRWGYKDNELDLAETRSYDFRNIAAHGGDAALVNLGYPANATRTMKRQRTIAGDQLAISVLNVDRRPMLFALCEAVRLLLAEVAAQAWDDQRFERNFAA